MQKVADLHVHTNLSDGTFSPEKVVECSKAMGLCAISITDHDCVDGIAPAIITAEDLGIEVIPGVELTAEMGEGEVHILGYFMDWQDKDFVKRLREISQVRIDRAKEILRKLKTYKIDISEEELFQLSGKGSVGRLHIAQLLFRKGYISSLNEAFKKYIGDSSPCHVKKFKLSPREAVDMIKGVGGVPVLAHPKTLYVKDVPREDIVKELVESGIQGIEAYHSDHRKKDEEEFKELARKFNLALTGGSDCHGFGKTNVLIGKVKIPYELVEKLKCYRFPLSRE